MICDTPVPYYDAGVHAGEPTDTGDSTKGDYLMFPRELVGMQPEIFIPVIGDSMKDAGIMEGDQLRVKAGVRIFSGDTVVASVNGECTVKAYCVDDDGRQWLVPRNDDYSPILLTPDMNIRFVGKVVGHLKEAPRTSHPEMIRAIKRSHIMEGLEQTLTPQRIESAIIGVAGMVKHARQWYAVYRSMVDQGALGEGEYSDFCDKIVSLLPDHGHLPTASELRRMCVQSFRKPVALWERGDAPVSGQRFDDYLRIANLTREKLRR